MILLPVAVAIGLNTGEDNDSVDPAATAGAKADVTPQTGAIQVRDFAFDPSTVTVTSGGTLTFDNTSTTEHRVKIGDEEEHVLKAGETFDWTASDSGTFDLVCTLHRNLMMGKVTVEG